MEKEPLLEAEWLPSGALSSARDTGSASRCLTPNYHSTGRQHHLGYHPQQQQPKQSSSQCPLFPDRDLPELGQQRGASQQDNDAATEARGQLFPGQSVSPKDNDSHFTSPPETPACQVKDEGSSGEVPKNKAYKMALITAVAFFMSCASRLHSPLTTQYIYQTYTDQVYGNASLGVHVSKHPCVNHSNNSAKDPLRNEVQEKSADLVKHLELVSGGVAIVTNIFLGSYSDVLGRRFALLIALTGHFLRNASASVIIYWDLGLSGLYAGYALDGLCGGSIGIKMAYYTYTVDITRGEKQRTLGLAVIETVTAVATAGLDIAAGLFIEDTGFLYPSMAAAAVLLISIAIVIFLLPETVRRDRKRSAADMSPAMSARRMLRVLRLRDFPTTPPSLFWGCWPTSSKSWRATESASLYLLAQPFCMSAFASGVLSAVGTVAQELAGLTLIKVLQRKVSTQGLAIMGCLSCIANNVIKALAKNDVMIYVSSGAALLSPVISPALRAMMCRLVTSDTLGTLFAWMALVESVCKSCAQMAFTPIYESTLTFMAGFAFLIAAGCYVLIIVLQLMYAYLLKRREMKQVTSVSVQADNMTDTNDVSNGADRQHGRHK